MGGKQHFPLSAALPGLLVGCALYLTGGIVGPRIGPGWSYVIEGSAFFVGLAGIVIGIRRASSSKK